MKFRNRYVVRATEDQEELWAVCERQGVGEQILAWTHDRDVAYLIAEALEVLPITVAAMEEWDAGFRDSPKLEALKYRLLDLHSAKKRSDLRLETHSFVGDALELLRAILVGMVVLLALIYGLSWLAKLL